MIDCVNTLSFNAKKAAFILTLAPIAVQERVMLIFRHWLDLLHDEYKEGGFPTERMNLLVEATRLNEGMQHFDG